jgi:hypothetical protein
MAIKTHFLSGTVISGKDARIAAKRLSDKSPNPAAKKAAARGVKLARTFAAKGVVRVSAKPARKASAK